MPFRIFSNAMLSNKLVLILCRRLMLTPHISLIEYKFALLYQIFCKFKCPVIQFNCHEVNLLSGAAETAMRNPTQESYSAVTTRPTYLYRTTIYRNRCYVKY